MSEVRLIEDWREKWEPVTKNGHTVLAVAYTGNEIQGWLTDNSGAWTCNECNLTRKPQPKKLRPWKREEVPVGSVVRSRTGNLVGIIDCVDNSTVCISVTGTGWTTPEKMFEEFVLHRTTESGEWLPVEQCPKCGVEE